MLLIAGLILIVLGLFSGGVLLIAPFGIAAVTPGIALWVLFPLLTLCGFLMAATAGEPAQVRTVSRATSATLLAFALAAAIALVLFASSLVAAVAGTASLWYVLAVGLLFGGAGLSLKGNRA